MVRPVAGSGTRPRSILAYFDGACEPVNPGGTASYGCAGFLDGAPAWTDWAIIGQGPGFSNNVAEYAGAIEALEWALRQGPGPIELRGDSLMLVRQMQGRWGVKAGRYVPLHHALKRMLPRGRAVTWTWVPRTENTLADALSKRAYHERGPRARRDYARMLAGGDRGALTGSDP